MGFDPLDWQPSGNPIEDRNKAGKKIVAVIGNPIEFPNPYYKVGMVVLAIVQYFFKTTMHQLRIQDVAESDFMVTIK